MAQYDIIAATGCPTGIAHTFMAKEALEKAAAERGLTIKVETHGQVGIENELTRGEIASARAVVVAADKDVQAERFAGKPMVSVGVSKALSVEEAGKLIDRALAAKGDASAVAAVAEDDDLEEKESIGHQIYKHLMNGVSHMLVFVVAGGVLTAISFLWGITSYDSTASDYNSFAAMLKIIGGIAMNLMVPVLSAYIAESIGKRPALVPGFVAGMIAIQGLPVNAETGLIDAGESLEEAVARELSEETGYRLRDDIAPAVRPLPQPGFSSTGLTEENVQVVFAQVEAAGKARPDSAELIEPFTVARADLRAFLDANQLPIGTRCQLILELLAI